MHIRYLILDGPVNLQWPSALPCFRMSRDHDWRRPGSPSHQLLTTYPLIGQHPRFYVFLPRSVFSTILDSISEGSTSTFYQLYKEEKKKGKPEPHFRVILQMLNEELLEKSKL